MTLADLDDPQAVAAWKIWPLQRRDDETESTFAGAWYQHVQQTDCEGADGLGELLVDLARRYLARFSLAARERLEHPATWVGRIVTAWTTLRDVDAALDNVQRQSPAFQADDDTDPWGAAASTGDSLTKEEVH